MPAGHAHVYFLDDYPACLNNEITCNGDHVLSLPGPNFIIYDPFTIEVEG